MADDVSFMYHEDASGRPITVMRSDPKPPLSCYMAQLEPAVYGALGDQLSPGAAGAMLGCHDGAWACLLAGAAANRDKGLRLTCVDAMHPAFDSNVAAWGADVTKGDAPESLDLACIDATRLTPEHAGAAVQQWCGAKVRPQGWTIVRGCEGPAGDVVKAELKRAGMRALVLDPPYGYHVCVCHRDADALARFADALVGLFKVMES